MRNIQPEVSRVDTLIITVGTRQVGWRCFDGIIRSFGADGNISYPPHVDELYRELKIERGSYQEKSNTYPWSACDLGKRYYDHCVDWLGGDFSSVELLLDHKIIEAGVQRGLKHIILWATNQPEMISWEHRRLDTIWLAKLMKGKIEATFPRVEVEVHAPVIAANDSKAVRQELENLLLPYALEFLSQIRHEFQTVDEEFVLWIENKGCAPAIAQGVEICAAALVRQCQVFNVIPKNPESYYEIHLNGSKSACPSPGYELVLMGEYFWPLERIRVISAWERGDFREAQIWLKPHRNRYEVLDKLAGHLALSTNWQIPNALKNIRGSWLCSDLLDKAAEPDKIIAWKEQINRIFSPGNEVDLVCEYCFLIYLALRRGDYTNAFVQFSQALERLLSLRSKVGNWQGKGYISPPEYPSAPPKFQELIEAWYKRFNKQDNWYKLLEEIRKKRNGIVHEAKSLTLEQLQRIWLDRGFPIDLTEAPTEMMKPMMNVIRAVCDRNWSIPEKTLLYSLYEWGLEVLQKVSAAS